MDERSYYSRRLSADELSVWVGLQVPDIPAVDRTVTQKCIEMEESMFFVSHLGDEMVGTSSIFRDKTRMCLLLSGLRITSALRGQLTKHVIRNSLPFFKSVAIREADAVVNRNLTEEDIPFPLVPDVGGWAEDGLIENGFKEKGTFYRVVYSVPDSAPETIHTWDEIPASFESLKSFYWKIPLEERPDHGSLWHGIILAGANNTLHTASDKSDPYLAMGAFHWKTSLVVAAAMFDPSVVSAQDVAAMICHIAHQSGLSSIVLDMMPSDSSIVNAMEQICGVSKWKTELLLYRKRL